MGEDSDNVPTSGGSGSRGRPFRPDLIRRAMRWETFALAAFLVVLALVFS